MKRCLVAAAMLLAAGSARAQYYFPAPYYPYPYSNYLAPGYGMPAMTMGQPVQSLGQASAPAQSAVKPAAHVEQEPEKIPAAKAPEFIKEDAGCCEAKPKTGCLDDCGHGCSGGFYAGAGFYFVKPVWDSNPAFITLSPVGTFGTSQTNFEYDYTFSPLVYLGFASPSGLGGRVRWWRFDQNEAVAAPPFSDSFPALDLGLLLGADNLFTSSSLRLDVLDFEATQDWRSALWAIRLAAGIRYAHLAQEYASLQSFSGIGGVVVVDSGHNFKGVGPTVAAEAERRLGRSDFSLYALGRGTLLWGDAEQSAFLSNSIQVGPATFAASTAGDDLLPVAELELGARWSREVGASRLFVQTAISGQAWFGAGNSANISVISQMGNAVFSEPDNNMNLGFFGLSFSTGVDF